MAAPEGTTPRMPILRWLLLGLLLLPVMELIAFIAVAVAIGFIQALGLILLGSLCGILLLRHGGGGHIARVRAAVNGRSFSALEADGRGGLIILSGILLLIPGFITDAAALVLLIWPALRSAAEMLGLRRPAPPRRSPDGVLDLEPEQWRRVPDPRLRDERD
jgi:UPF0716 protein FxsA